MRIKKRALTFFLFLCFIYGFFLHLTINEKVHHASDDCSYSRALSTVYVSVNIPNIECVFAILALTIFISNYIQFIFLNLKLSFYATRAPPLAFI